MSKLRVLNWMSEGKTIDCLYRTMINLNHSLCLSITTVTIIQKRFLLHLSGELLHKTGELEPSISTVTPGFCPRRRSFKPIMIGDVFYTAPKTWTHSILKQFKFIKTWQKKKDFIWLLTRCKYSEFCPHEKKMSSRTDFYHQVLTPIHDGIHLIRKFYLQIIDPWK